MKCPLNKDAFFLATADNASKFCVYKLWKSSQYDVKILIIFLEPIFIVLLDVESFEDWKSQNSEIISHYLKFPFYFCF